MEVYPFGSCVIRLVRRQRRESFPRPVCASVGPVGCRVTDRIVVALAFWKEPDSVFQSVIDGQFAAIQPLISSDLINQQLGRGFDVSL